MVRSRYKIYIEDGATVTLRDMGQPESTAWISVIECLGDATLILAGSVKSLTY